MAGNRSGLRAATAAVCAAGIAGAVWVLVAAQPPTDGDCTVVADMLSSYGADAGQPTALAVSTPGDPSTAIASYRERADHLRHSAESITDDEIRAAANSLVDLDVDIVDSWRRNASRPAPAETGSGEQAFLEDYGRYAGEHDRVVAELLAYCPEAR